PIWGEGEEDRNLAEAANGSLRRAEMLELETIAFPAISTGNYGFPKARAARVVCKTLQRLIAPPAASRLRLVRMVLYDELSAKIFAQIARQVFESVAPPCSAPRKPPALPACAACSKGASSAMKSRPLWLKACGWWKKLRP